MTIGLNSLILVYLWDLTFTSDQNCRPYIIVLACLIIDLKCFNYVIHNCLDVHHLVSSASTIPPNPLTCDFYIVKFTHQNTIPFMLWELSFVRSILLYCNIYSHNYWFDIPDTVSQPQNPPSIHLPYTPSRKQWRRVKENR